MSPTPDPSEDAPRPAAATPLSDAAASGPEYFDIESVAADCLWIQSIAAPTGAEHDRAAWVADRMRALGLRDVTVDDTPNVYARLPGAGGPAVPSSPADGSNAADENGSEDGEGTGHRGALEAVNRSRLLRTIMLSAHTDTVFPASVDLTSRREGDTLFGPAIGDNSMGVAGLLALAESLSRCGPFRRDIWFVANAAEEGLGDLRGMRAAVSRLGGPEGIAASIVLEGTSSGPWLVTHRALGSKRYRVDVAATGGHSWGDFGSPSAVHYLLRLAEPITRWTLPARPRASFNVGVIDGGASVNTIAEHAHLLLDLRSEESGTLSALDRRAQRLFQAAADRAPDGVDITWRLVGDRPSGSISAEHPLVRRAIASGAAVGVPEDKIVLSMSSTDANVPLAEGIPAVTLYLTLGGDAHRESEWLSLSRLQTGLRWAHQLVRETANT